MKFDPFENRTCRDVRNNLGQAVVKSIQTQSMEPFSEVQKTFKISVDQTDIHLYIDHRKNCLEQIINQISTDKILQNTENQICMLLWNHELFFELHEWLEEKWAHATGDQKKGLQALIFATVAFEHLSYGRQKPAKKMVYKSMALLDQYPNHIPKWVDSILFKERLNTQDLTTFKV